MLDYVILASKPNIIDKEGNEYKDLLSKVMRPITKDSTPIKCKLITVTEDYVARPDLVSLAVYGTDGFADIICKLNGISNPFELNEGDVLMIPNLSQIELMFDVGEPSSIVSNEKDTKLSSINKTNQKPKNSIRKPNEQIVGQHNYYIDKNKNIIYY